MTRLQWASEARSDIAGTSRYIHASNPRAAMRVVAAIQQSAALLKDNPLSGEPLGDGATRKASVGAFPYVLIYRVDRGSVVILRVRHAAEDWR